MSKAETTTVAIALDANVGSRIRKLAELRQRSTDWLIAEAVREYVDREEKRTAFHQDGVNAWNAYQLTGQHVPSAVADAWLAELEDGKTPDLPPWRS
ncbi:MAG: ribbon-helix-helix protein, CopG family [Xanthomonadales bacterium]|jgi:predicted transcriptional regulator|nr:ribbon-helix-helix protein, CopG family [Xanthomonadales bacterium]